MPDIIQLLPDSVANQIAAGEVIQRPASAVKELIENAIDAGADSILLVVKDAGKSLIQVIDNGSGMSATDARMCFERHATSKIRKAEDIFAIRTMGFRGEALASIAAIAHVELKTRLHDEQTGIQLIIEGSEVRSQEACSSSPGSSISVKNLFYNIPARRSFLKSNPVELRHIIDEFQRVALAHPAIFFSMHHDGGELFHLPAGNLRQRITHIFGHSYDNRLVPAEEQTDIISLKGFIGKPEFARKTRGEQFFFVNNRFIRDPYLHHAVMNAYEGLLPDDSYPFYALFIDIDPGNIDVNVHPTKTEIKFEDDRAIYAILRSAVKRSLGRYNITPSLDFSQETGFNHLAPLPAGEMPKPPVIRVNPDFNPFTVKKDVTAAGISANLEHWQSLKDTSDREELAFAPAEPDKNAPLLNDSLIFQLHQRFIITPIKSGMMVIDQQAAHERVLYERYLHLLQNQSGSSQQCLFPQTIELNAPDSSLLEELQPDLQALGFDIRAFGKNTFVIHGVPSETGSGNEKQMLEGLLETFKQQQQTLRGDRAENLSKALARQSAIRSGKMLSREEMSLLIDELFACSNPQVSLTGKPVLITLSLEELLRKFEKSGV